MSGALKGYRYLTGLCGVVTSRHHALAPAEAFRTRNAHQPIRVYRLPQSMPISEGEIVPESAVEIYMSAKSKPLPSTYRR